MLIIFITSPIPKQRPVPIERYQFILIYLANYLSGLYNSLYWIGMAAFGVRGSFYYKAHFTKIFAYSLVVISLYNISNLIYALTR